MFNGQAFEATTREGIVRDLVQINLSGKRNLIYTSARPEVVIRGFAVSPDNKKIAVALGRDERSRVTITVVDIATKTPIVEGIPSGFYRLFWSGNNDLLFTPNRNGDPLQRWNSRSNRISNFDGTSMFPLTQNWATLKKDQQKFLINSSGERFAIRDGLRNTIELGNQLVAIGGLNNNRLERITVENGAAGSKQLIYQTENRIIRQIKNLGPKVMIVTHRGADRWIEILDNQGNQIQEISVPNYADFIDASWISDREVRLTFASPAIDRADFIYDLKTKQFADADMENKMLTFKGVRFVTEVVNVKSPDGYEFPMRLTRRRDLRPSPTNVTLVRAYGGYIAPGFLDPSFNLIESEFVFSGGLLAGPAVRGGNEFGQESWKAGSGLNKINAITDLNTAVKWMSQSGWSSPSKIITRGHSQGGHTTVTAAIMEPKIQALTLASAGIYDPADPRVFNPFEHGDPQHIDDPTATFKVSPVVLIHGAKAIPRLFLIAGEEDSVVPSDQIGALLKAARQNSHYEAGSIQTLKIPGYGHAVTFQWSLNPGAQKAETEIWTRIFELQGSH